MRFDPWIGKIPRRGHGNPLQYSCLEHPMDRGAWQATVYGVTRVGHDWVTCVHACARVRARAHTHTHTEASLVAQTVNNPAAMQDTWVWTLGWEDPLEEGMATHFSILAWRIPWTEEPGGLQPMGSQRVGHNWPTKHSTAQDVWILKNYSFIYRKSKTTGAEATWFLDLPICHIKKVQLDKKIIEKKKLMNNTESWQSIPINTQSVCA